MSKNLFKVAVAAGALVLSGCGDSDNQPSNIIDETAQSAELYGAPKYTIEELKQIPANNYIGSTQTYRGKSISTPVTDVAGCFHAAQAFAEHLSNYNYHDGLCMDENGKPVASFQVDMSVITLKVLKP